MYRRLFPCLVLLSAATCFAQFNYAPINFPGAVATVAHGINNSGEIVGYYQTTTCTNYDANVPDCPTKGFKFQNNTYTKLMVPNSTSTAIMGVNDYGDLVGFYRKSDGTRHGFIWYHWNSIRTIDYPNTKFTTVPMGMNRAGTVVGGLFGLGQTGTFSQRGWVWKNGTFSTMNPGGSGNGTCCQSVNGINNNGGIVGQVFYLDFWQGWLKQAGDEDFFKDQSDSFATAVDNSMDVIGYSSVSAGGWFVKSAESNEAAGDVENNLAFMPVTYPSAKSTQPFGINNARYVVGSYTDSAGHRHGFLAQPTF